MNKFRNFLKTAAAQWAMNSDPVVVQASGYVPTKTGVEYKPSEGSSRLSDNIAVISTIPNMLMNTGMTGIIPAIASEVGAAVGGVGGTLAGQKLDNKLNTTYWTPTLGFFGTLLGGGFGYKAGNKYGKYAIKHDILSEGAANRRIVTDDMVKEAALEMVDEQLAKATLPKSLPHNVGWAPAEKSIWWHHSNEPITEFKIPFEGRWDAEKHGADSRLIWFTKEDGTKGMMAKRPHHTQFEIEVKKPMVQVGEVPAPKDNKNPYRNEIVRQARNMGADAVIFDGIADNTLENQKVVAVLGDKVIPSFKSPVIRVFSNTGLGLGQNNPISLTTHPKSAYRVTGQDQIDDIFSSGFIRPKPGGVVKGGHQNEVHFAQGGPKLFYYDKRPVIEIDMKDIKDGMTGNIPKDKIKSIWTWSDSEGRYVDILNSSKNTQSKQLSLFPEPSFDELRRISAQQRASGNPEWIKSAEKALELYNKNIGKVTQSGIFKTIDDITYGFDFPYGPQETISLIPSSKQPYDILSIGAMVPKDLRSRVGSEQYRQYLKDFGYDLSGITDETLGGIMHARLKALKEMPDVAIAYPDEVVLRHNGSTAGRLEFGDLKTEGVFTAPTVKWYGRTTTSGAPYPHDNVQNWYKGNVTAPLYNAAVLEAKRQGYPGIFSGIALLSPKKTKAGLSKFAHIDFPWKGTSSYTDIDDYAQAIYKKHLYETGNHASALRESNAMQEMLESLPEGSSTEMWMPDMLQLLVGGESKIPAKSIFLNPDHFQDILKTNSFVGNKGFHYKEGGNIT